MSHKNDQHHHTRADFEAELTHHDEWFRHSPDEHHQESHGSTNPWAISGVMVAVIIITFGVAFYALNYLGRAAAALKAERHEALTDTSMRLGGAYRETRANWEAAQSQYTWVDAKAGVVRIPMDRAIDKVVRQYAEHAAKKN